MRKQSFLITDEQGFFLPYVLFVTALVFIVLTASINIYKNDIEITHGLSEQLKIKTLLQMGKQQFRADIDNIDSMVSDIEYSFPEGTVRIDYDLIDEKELSLSFNIKTRANTAYSFSNIVMQFESESGNKNKQEGGD